MSVHMRTLLCEGAGEYYIWAVCACGWNGPRNTSLSYIRARDQALADYEGHFHAT